MGTLTKKTEHIYLKICVKIRVIEKIHKIIPKN